MKLDIDEELWYGVSSDEQAEAQAAKSMAARMGRIVGAKPFPVAAQRLSQLTQDPNCLMDEVVSVLESDPALSARLLRLVNSVGFSLRTPCSSVRHAAALVGTEKLNQVASTAAILDMYESSSARAAQLLEHATEVGALCRYLAFHFGLPPDELFTCGFLHDIGKLMLLDTEGDEYLALLDEDPCHFDTTFIEERKRFGFDHALLAGHVLAAWNIPHPIPKVVAWHHHVTRAYAESTQISQMVSTLRLADAMSYALRQPDSGAQIETLARMESASYMDISEAQLAAMWDEVRALTERARAVFRGEKVPESDFSHTSRPSGASMRAVARAKLQDHTPSNSPAPPVLSERPRHFPCVVCDAPSYAHRCSACHGYMCPLHVAGEDEWCELCQRSYEDAGIPEIRPVVSTLFGALLGGLLAAAFFGAASAGAQRPMRLMVGPTLILMLLGMLVGIAQRWVRRWWFLRTRPNRASIMPSAVEAMLDMAKQQSPTIVEVGVSSQPASPPTERLGMAGTPGASLEASAQAATVTPQNGPKTSVEPESSRSDAGDQRDASPVLSEPTASNLRNPDFPSPPAMPNVDGNEAPGQLQRAALARERHWMSSSRPVTPVPGADLDEAPEEPQTRELAEEASAPAVEATPLVGETRSSRRVSPGIEEAPSAAKPGTDLGHQVLVSARPSARPSSRASAAVASARPSARSTASVQPSARNTTSVRPNGRNTTSMQPSARNTASVQPSARQSGSQAPAASGRPHPNAGATHPSVRPSTPAARRSTSHSARPAASARPSSRESAAPPRSSNAPRGSAPPAFATDSAAPAVEMRASTPARAASAAPSPTVMGSVAMATEDTQLDIVTISMAPSANATASSKGAPSAEVPESAVQAVTSNEPNGTEPPGSWSSVLDAQGTASGW